MSNSKNFAARTVDHGCPCPPAWLVVGSSQPRHRRLNDPIEHRPGDACFNGHEKVVQARDGDVGKATAFGQLRRHSWLETFVAKVCDERVVLVAVKPALQDGRVDHNSHASNGRPSNGQNR